MQLTKRIDCVLFGPACIHRRPHTLLLRSRLAHISNILFVHLGLDQTPQRVAHCPSTEKVEFDDSNHLCIVFIRASERRKLT
jgi:hypothetical protein